MGSKFCKSLKETGFAILRNTPLGSARVKPVLKNWQHFFRDTPLPEKRKYLYDPDRQSGYFPYKVENAKDQKSADLKEFYHIFNFGDIPESRLENPLITAELIHDMKNLGYTLLGYIARDIDNPSVLDTALKSTKTLFRTIYYPALDKDTEVTGVRAAAHEDINLITLLPAASDSGLEVLDAKEQWHLVDYAEGDMVVNVGDMLQMLTEGAYKSTTHRVQNPKDLTEDRVSMPLFIHPTSDYNLGPMTAGQYLDNRLKEIGLKKTA